jgi:ribonuclease P protein component
LNSTERYFYGRVDKLKSRKVIELLFKSGHSFSNYPFKVIWLPQNTETLQAGVAVSSRNFKKATDRNRIKRLIREAYRLQKNILKDHLLRKEMSLSIFIIYTGKELPVYEEVFKKMGVIINRLIKLVDEKTENLS